jgi:gas vesicle protein
MDKQQIRHSKAMASKIKQHAQQIVNEMSSIERISIDDFKNVPVTNLANRFTHDMGYGVQDRLDAIERVISDMIGELQPDTTNIGNTPDDTPQPPY